MGSLSVSVGLPFPHSDGSSGFPYCISSVCVGTAHVAVLSCSDTDVQSQRVGSCCDLWV